MTKAMVEAQNLLQRPVFGNEFHIKALRLLCQEEEAAGLRKVLKGKKTQCWCCNGTGEFTCSVGCCDAHPCNTCNGEDKLELREEILSKLDIWQLRDIVQELGI